MRRSEPPLLGPWWAHPSAAEQRFQDAARMGEDGRLYAGSDPWFDCSRCGVVFDTEEFGCCPGCLAYSAYCNRQHWAALALEAAETNNTH